MTVATPNVNTSSEKVRVRIPGKYIVLGCLAVTGIFLSSLSYLKTIDGTAAVKERVIVDGSTSYMPLEPFLVDLSPDLNGQITYLRLGVTFILENQRSGSRVDAVSPLLRERMTFFLRNLTPEDLSGSEEMERVKAELFRRVTLVVGEGVVNDLAINEIVIQ